MRFGWTFDRGPFDPDTGTTPIRVTFQTGDDAAVSTLQAIITEEAARDMRAALDEVCGSGLAVATSLPPTNGATG